MTVKLRKLEEQTIVLTGATSGIGLVTARKAAERGARLVLAARNEESLKKLCDEIRENGGEAVYVAGDVGNEGDVKKIAANSSADRARRSERRRRGRASPAAGLTRRCPALTAQLNTNHVALTKFS